VTNQANKTRAKARERLAAERAAQAAAQKRRDRIMRIVLSVVVVALVVGIGVAVIVSRQNHVASNAAAPAGVTATKGYPTGTATKPVLDIYEDFQCPNCRDFEAANRTAIQALATDGKAQVVYHTLTFLDADNTSNPAATQQSSTRAAIAGGCAQDQGKFLAMHDELYKNQPAKEGTGWTDAELVALGKAAGIPDMTTFSQCLSQRTYAGFLTQVSAEADSRQVTGTPTFFVNGKIVDTSNAASWADVGKIVENAVASAGS
jgi:protein-disulfide isomerase